MRRMLPTNLLQFCLFIFATTTKNYDRLQQKQTSLISTFSVPILITFHHSITQYTHDEAVKALKRAGRVVDLEGML